MAIISGEKRLDFWLPIWKIAFYINNGVLRTLFPTAIMEHYSDKEINNFQAMERRNEN